MQSSSDNKVLSGQWYRKGGGHNFIFHATRSEISQIILDFFSETPEKVYICGTDSVQLENSEYYKQVSFCYPIVEILECLVQHKKSLNFYIGLERLTPSSSLILANQSGMMSLSGLIRLQIFYFINDKTKRMQPSNIGVVNTIAHNDTGEIIEHVEYYKLFQQMKRRLKKRLPYKTKFHGHQTIDTSCFMSEGIVERWKAGEVFEHDPILE